MLWALFLSQPRRLDPIVSEPKMMSPYCLNMHVPGQRRLEAVGAWVDLGLVRYLGALAADGADAAVPMDEKMIWAENIFSMDTLLLGAPWHPPWLFWRLTCPRLIFDTCEILVVRQLLLNNFVRSMLQCCLRLSNCFTRRDMQHSPCRQVLEICIMKHL